MADNIVKKIRINKKDLPDLDVSQQGYMVRYRIVSEDKNRYSHWSPISVLKPEYVYTTDVTLKHSTSGSINTIVWGQVTTTKNSTIISKSSQYDVWVKWNRTTDNTDGDWIYQQRTDTNSIILPTPSTYTINNINQNAAPNRLFVEIYLPGSPISRSSTFLRVYENSATPFNV